MTCIAAIIENDEIWMGCDTLTSYGDMGFAKDTKIVKKDNMIMGFSGKVRDINLLRFGFEIPEQDKKMNDYEYMATVFTKAVRERLKEYGAAKVEHHEETGQAYILIGYSKQLYKMSGDYSVARIEDTSYFATGSGQELALGSLYSTEGTGLTPEKRLTKALEAAEKFIRSVRGPFVIEYLK